ncbi:hypothetical protein [Salinivibrio costicola]|uniref:hypothetical protein n=1 Tax=Salinivibrio costicola TaxID=51367 RepID=UPI000471E65E|nr:hypothetical protein [Salinivibrio costicola]
MELYELVITIIGLVFGGYLAVWSIPGIIMFSLISLGDIKRIVLLDKYLSQNINKYYTEQGYLKPYYQTPYSIGTRLLLYWISYPITNNRKQKLPKKMKVFMWVNCIGVWSFIITPLFSQLIKHLD